MSGVLYYTAIPENSTDEYEMVMSTDFERCADERDAAQSELAALREELAEKQASSEMFYQKQRLAETKQANAERKLAGAEQRNAELVELLREVSESLWQEDDSGDLFERIDAAVQSGMECDRLQSEIERMKGGQGEPVAWRTGSITWSYKADATRHAEAHGFEVVALWESQPAPVSVVLDENQLIEIARKSALESTHRYNYMPCLPEEAYKWFPHSWVIEAMRACLDKVKELNQ